MSGVDISLASMTADLQKVHPFGSGQVMLVSQTGQWLVAPNPELRMTDYKDTGADIIKAALSEGKAGVIENIKDADEKLYRRVIYPLLPS